MDYVKAGARIVHFLSIGMLCSFLTGPLLIDDADKIPKWNKMFGHFGGIGLILSGLVNWWLLKSYKPHAEKKDFVFWTAVVHSKLLLLILFFTPIGKFFFKNEKTLNSVRIFFVCLFFAVTPFVRRLRESYNPMYVNKSD